MRLFLLRPVFDSIACDVKTIFTELLEEEFALSQLQIR